MLKKISYVFLAGLICLLLLQLLEISNLDSEANNFSQQLNLVQYLNYASIFFVVVFLLTNFLSLSQKAISIDKSESFDSDANYMAVETQTVQSVSDNEIRLSAINNKLILILSKCSSIEEVSSKFLSLICTEYKLAQGILSVRKKDSDEFYISGTYAYYNENTGYSFRIGEGICGQVAKNQQSIVLSNIPEDYINIVSGLGIASPKFLQVIPIIYANDVIAVLEIASFTNDLLQTNDLETGVLKQLSNSLNGLR